MATDDERVCCECKVYVPVGQPLHEAVDGRFFCGDCRIKVSQSAPVPAPAPIDWRDRVLSEVARRDEAGNLHCPVCGGSQFEATRSLGMKLALGFASLVLPANQVRCVTCGTVFKRG